MENLPEDKYLQLISTENRFVLIIAMLLFFVVVAVVVKCTA